MRESALFCAIALCAACRPLEIPDDESSSHDPPATHTVAQTMTGTLSCSIPLSPQSMPIGLAGAAAVTTPEGAIYVVGGSTAGGVPTAQGFVFNPSTGRWAEIAPMPTALPMTQPLPPIGGAWAHGKLYVVSDRTYEYDPASDTWATKAALPAARIQDAVTAGTDGTIFSISEFSASAYDPVADRWRDVSDVPNWEYWPNAVKAPDGSIYTFGDQHAGRYVPAQDDWSELPDLDLDLMWGAGAIAGDRLYSIGGVTVNVVNAASIADVRTFDVGASTWAAGVPLPAPTSLASAVTSCNGRIYVFGGERLTNPANLAPPLDAVQVFDPATGTWSTTE